MLTRIVDSKYHLLMLSLDEVGGPIDRFQWVALLRSVAGWEEYLRCHPGGVEPAKVADFLLLDERFPRSLRCSIESLLQSLEEATRGADPALRNTPMLRVTEIRNRLRYASAESILASGLHEYIFDVQQSPRAPQRLAARAFLLVGASCGLRSPTGTPLPLRTRGRGRTHGPSPASALSSRPAR